MKFSIGQLVRKISGSEWSGRIVGTYSTELTPEGYCVESETHKGSVQIYPAKALEPVRQPMKTEHQEIVERLKELAIPIEFEHQKIAERLKVLANAVADQQWSEFSMRVPAEPDRDADIVLMKAAMMIAQLAADRDTYKQGMTKAIIERDEADRRAGAAERKLANGSDDTHLMKWRVP